MTVENGLSFTLIEAPSPMDDPDSIGTYNPRQQFRVARRVWLGWNAGTDWLHDAIEAELGEDTAWYDVQSKRDATHIGASSEVAAVVLILMGLGAADMLRTYYNAFAQRLGEASADAFLDWVREKSRERRRTKDIEWTDGPPDLLGDGRDLNGLSYGMTGELAEMLGVPKDRLELVNAGRRLGSARFVYRDTDTGRLYSAELHRDSATFRPLDGLPPGDS